MSEADLGVCSGFLVGGAVPLHWRVELGLGQGGQGYAKECVWGQLWAQEVLRQPVCCVPNLLVVWPEMS